MPVDAAETLLAWYDAHARRLPWRAPPGTAAPDPYRVWLSEIMLQQTTTTAVKPYFAVFTNAWPTVEALAAADETEVLAAWAGLGYYARARNLVACARTVAERFGGAFPADEASLRSLPGVGRYTAAAITAIAFGRRAVVIDANVARVAARLAALTEPLPAARAALETAVDAITPAERAGDFAQAMMDLGATICTPREPACAICPLRGGCEGARRGIAAQLPVKAARRVRPHRRGTAFWLERDGQVLLARRPSRGLLGGMRALPGGPWGEAAEGTAGAPADVAWRHVGTVEHAFTHFALSLDVLAAEGEAEGEWWPIDEIDAAGLPTLFAKAVRLALAARTEQRLAA